MLWYFALMCSIYMYNLVHAMARNDVKLQTPGLESMIFKGHYPLIPTLPRMPLLSMMASQHHPVQAQQWPKP